MAIGGYLWLFYEWLLLAIIPVVINSYSIGVYSINDYQWLLY